MDDATRARLDAQHVEQPEGGFCETCGSLWEWPCAVRALLTAYDALVAERAQAAPVLAAADRWRDDHPPFRGSYGLRSYERLIESVDAWRAGKLA